MTRKILKISLKIAAVILSILLLFLGSMFLFDGQKHKDFKLGTTFDARYSNFLGLDAKENLSVILDEWNFRFVRFVAPWNSVEKERGRYDFSELDWQMEAAKQKGAKVMLSIGQKTPRWPECHLPDWSKDLSKDDYADALKKYITEVVNRYKDHPALEIWQVENETFVKFGVCPAPDGALLDDEISLVKKLDPNHQTITTDSGELSFWFRVIGRADLFGSTMYRTVWAPYIGYFRYSWLAPGYYRFRLMLHMYSPDKAIISELQAEPWIPRGTFFDTSFDEQMKSMSLQNLQDNIKSAERTGFSRAYLWGAEWWYWLEKNGHPEIPDFVKGLKK